MGLDLVEFVIRVEEEFDLYIPDEVRSSFVTPRRVIDYISSQTPEKAREEVAGKVWKILVYETGIDRSKFNEDSRFIEGMGID
jgi:hypothetical protein